jgi:DNA-binding XRE family transcriptional regulator
MAKPRIFLSSTYYDLRHIRTDLERYIREQGYEPVLNEQGSIAYGKEDRLEEYCYKEISNVDILVSIIGGRYGSESKIEKHSVSQMELKTAFDLNKQVYIFIEKGVYNEYNFYLKNKDNETTKYTYADNIKIHQFIEFVESLPNNNTIHGFETSADIVSFLKEQWAGLFQRFLQEQTRVKEINIIKGIENTAKTLNQLVTFLTEEKRGSENAINEILLSNHPAMEQIKELLKIPYRVFFINKDEFIDLIKARGFRESNDDFSFDNRETWLMEKKSQIHELTYSDEIFNSDSKLKVYTKEEWNPEFITLTITKIEEVDDLPF